MKALFSLATLALLLMTCADEIVAQTVPTGDSLDYFPYRMGDSWRLRRDDIPGYPPLTRTVLHDSVDDVGNIYLTNLNIKIDTAGDVYVVGDLQYRLRAKKGDRWRAKDLDSATPFYVTCMGNRSATIFGQPVMLKVFNYWYDASSSGLPDSMWYATRYLARGFGEVQEYYEPDALFYLSGAIIKGQAYGDMIAGVASTVSGSSSLRVTPNPFAETVRLSYHLDSRERVRLTVSDAYGHIIATPVDEIQNAGEQTATIDGSTLPDGAYFYQLHTPSYAVSGTLIRQH